MRLNGGNRHSTGAPDAVLANYREDFVSTVKGFLHAYRQLEPVGPEVSDELPHPLVAEVRPHHGVESKPRLLVEQVGQPRNVAVVPGVVDLAHDLDVLLRHPASPFRGGQSLLALPP